MAVGDDQLDAEVGSLKNRLDQFLGQGGRDVGEEVDRGPTERTRKLMAGQDTPEVKSLVDRYQSALLSPS